MSGEIQEFDKHPLGELLEICQLLLQDRSAHPGQGFEPVRAGLFRAILKPELRASRNPGFRRGVVGYRLSTWRQLGLFNLAANLQYTSVGFIADKEAAIHKAHEASHHSLARSTVYSSPESPWHRRTVKEYTPAYLGADRQIYPDKSKPSWYVCTLSIDSIDGRGDGTLVNSYIFSTDGDFEKIGPAHGGKIELLPCGQDDIGALTQSLQALSPS